MQIAFYFIIDSNEKFITTIIVWSQIERMIKSLVLFFLLKNSCELAHIVMDFVSVDRGEKGSTRRWLYRERSKEASLGFANSLKGWPILVTWMPNSIGQLAQLTDDEILVDRILKTLSHY
jgi:hypothetical protein